MRIDDYVRLKTAALMSISVVLFTLLPQLLLV